ncbi:hypothetical protein RFI_23386 [Reticulomyxa filosa]|uniref:DH domain-containing protein n=1 Tax=Reticulomyxa filosa TaxID=46433 RepID=X6MKK8_RETFI|nr:hypothetical protein RFI_23386 [Reticulomyxa filosa]|eukprot:ETO13982.1 hypothetical protein RFI_23386 [Reticulomyxa filosa]
MTIPGDTVQHEAENAIFLAVQELAQTERSYLKSLNQLRRVMNNCKDKCILFVHEICYTFITQKQEYINKMLETKVLSEEKIHAYFLEILIINGIHYLLSENLERELDCWPSSQIPQLFLQFVWFFFFFLFLFFVQRKKIKKNKSKRGMSKTAHII